MSEHGMWASLGHRGNTAPPPPVDDEQDDFARPSVQRVVPAVGAPSVVPAAAITNPFITSYKPAGSAVVLEAEPAAAANVTEDHQVATKTKAARGGRNIQQVICLVLIGKGPLTREQLAAESGLEGASLSNAIFNAKATGRIAFVEKSSTFRITKEGRAWCEGKASSDDAPPPKATKRAAKKARAPRAPKRNVETAPAMTAAPAPRGRFGSTELSTAVVLQPSFKCAVFSDGGFFLAKGEARIELDAQEHAQMLRYLERMAEQPA